MNAPKNLANIGKYAENNPSKTLSVFAQVRIQAPHVFAKRSNSPRCLPACIGLCQGVRANYTALQEATFEQCSKAAPAKQTITCQVCELLSGEGVCQY